MDSQRTTFYVLGYWKDRCQTKATLPFWHCYSTLPPGMEQEVAAEELQAKRKEQKWILFKHSLLNHFQRQTSVMKEGFSPLVILLFTVIPQEGEKLTKEWLLSEHEGLNENKDWSWLKDPFNVICYTVCNTIFSLASTQLDGNPLGKRQPDIIDVQT